jgi:ribosome-interacting GTPase 1
MRSPVVLPLGSSVVEMAGAIHKDFAQQLKYARVWGSSKFDGQRVQRDYVVREGDVIELHI